MSIESPNSFPGDNSARILRFFSRYLSFLPLLIICLILGFISSFIYLRYSHYIYDTKGKVVLSLEQGPNKDEKLNLTALASNNATSSITPEEKAIELFQSKVNISQVVKNLGLYTEVISTGRFINKPNFGFKSPLTITSPFPDSIFREYYVKLRLDPQKNLIYLGGLAYPIGRLVRTQYGWFRFDYQTLYSENPLPDNFQLHIIPVGAMSSSISGRLRLITNSKGSNIVEIHITDELPERSKAIIPMMIKVYDSISSVKQRETNENIIRFIDDRLKVILNELNEIERQLAVLKSHFKTESLQTEVGIYFSKTEEINKEISTLNNQKNILDDVEIYLKQVYKGKISLPSVVELNNATMTSQLLQLFDYESQLEKQNGISGKLNPETIFLKERIATLRPAILESIHNLKRTYEISLKNYQKDLNHYNQLLKEVPNQEKALVDITRRQEAKNVIYSFLLQKKEEVSINSAAIFPVTQILEKAEGARLVAPESAQTYVLFGLFSLAIGIGLISAIEALDNSVKSKVEIDQVLSSPIIGEISRIKKFETDRPIVFGSNQKSIHSEQFRSLRTNLSYLGMDSPHKVIMITSSIMKEGKSFLIINIATAFALSGKKVVLMDFDLRKPKISNQFVPENHPGITNFLVGSTSLEEIMYKVPNFQNLYIIPSGIIPPNPTEIILSKQIGALMEFVRKEFEYVLVDTPPIGIVSDAKLLAPYADLTLYTIRQGKTPRLFLRFIQNLITEKVLPNLGIVLNDIKLRNYGYGYEYAYELEDSDKKGILWGKIWGFFKF